MDSSLSALNLCQQNCYPRTVTPELLPQNCYPRTATPPTEEGVTLLDGNSLWLTATVPMLCDADIFSLNPSEHPPKIPGHLEKSKFSPLYQRKNRGCGGRLRPTQLIEVPSCCPRILPKGWANSRGC